MADKKTIALKVTVDTSEVEESVERTTETVEELGDTTKKTSSEMKQGFKSAEQGTKGLGSSISGLIKSLGIIGVAMAVFNFMKDLLMKNQKVMDALNTATIALEILFNKLFESVEPIGEAMQSAFSDPKQAISDLWEAIKTNFINRLEGLVVAATSVGKVLKGVFELDWDTVKEGATDYASALVQIGTGLDREQQEAIVEGVKNFAVETVAATKATIEQASSLVALRNELELLEAGQKKIQMTYQRDAELQRQRRDDIRLTLAERIEANDKLGSILDKQIKEEQVLADKRLALAIKERDELGATTERKAAVLIAEGELADLKERIAGQESEQLTNQAALEKELFDIQQELRVATLEEREKELEELDVYYEALAEKARIAGEDQVEIENARIKAIEDLKDKHRKEDQAEEAKTRKTRIEADAKEADARLGIASSVAGSLGAIVQALGNQSKASVAIQKTLAIAQIAIDTARSITSAIAGATASAAGTGVAAVATTPVFIATQIATVLAGVAQAVGVLNSAPGGGTASVPSVNVPTSAAAAPSFNPVTTNTTELGGTEQAELAPIQAFVVETQITGNQENVNQIEGQAEFGGG